jgi:methionyl-tRNA formyltransferase
MRIIFSAPHFAIPALNALLHAGKEVIAVVTQPDKRKQTVFITPPVKVAVEKGIQSASPYTSDTSFLDELNSLARPHCRCCIRENPPPGF